jgi:hypothetical protein
MDIAIKRTPIFATKIQTASSGKELRASFQSTPRYRYSLPLNFLRQAVLNADTDEVAMLLNIFNAAKGRWDSFLYTDPYSNTAANTPFGTGGGSTSAFQILDIEGMPIFDLNGTPTITRTDWQGTQTLYLTPRTNLILQSQTLNSGSWNNSNATVADDSEVAPDGTTTAEVFTATGSGSSNPYGIQQITLQPGTYTVSAWMKGYGTAIGKKAGPWPWAAGTGTISGTLPPFQNLTGSWQRFTLTFTVATAGTFYIRWDYSSGAAAVGERCAIWGFQVETGSAATAYIPTTTAAVTVTDYTLSSTGLVTLGQAPVLGAALAWSGNYYRRVRFDTDELDFERFLDRVWEAKALPLISVK